MTKKNIEHEFFEVFGIEKTEPNCTECEHYFDCGTKCNSTQITSEIVFRLEEILSSASQFLLCVRKHTDSYEYILFQSGNKIKELTFCQRKTRESAILGLLRNLYTDNCSRYTADENLKDTIEIGVKELFDDK